MTRRLFPARPALGALGLAVSATMLSGCMYLSPAQTTQSYDPADGTIATVGSLQLSDVLVVASAKGARGALIGMVTNNGQSEVKLTISPQGGAGQSVTIPAQTAVRLDGKTSGDSKTKIKPVTVAKVTAAPGKPMTITFTTSKAGATPIQVPVLLSQGIYGSASPSHPTYSAPPNGQTTEPDG
ncbi:hypothetical protein [Leekyejoonella antrihumi]|uniref:DNA modification methylase n=1 Tax=Leekyejoonella antrihumi TaxID=1660198 RepID=A0A563E8M6_9MICO|nr:hypothetical protein [Leekyejoonella antrihumi]TWP38876.1 hypothetical protein FGL98_00235 [Leekyejoonella antrihumi]